MQTDRKKRGVVSATIASAALISMGFCGSASAQDKLQPHERQAMHVRVLQSNMMVAALNCDLKQQYGDAVRRFQPEFVVNASHLRSYFDRVYGKRGRTELDRFITTLANQASSRAVSQGMDYCRGASSLMQQILTTPVSKLAEFSGSLDGIDDLSVTFLAGAGR